MKTFTTEELDKILKKHQMWLNGAAGVKRANLSYANLRDANLSYTNLSYADLSYTDLSYTDLRDAKLPAFQICPEKGSFTAFKKVKISDNSYILELKIPAAAQRISTPVGRKCRASRAKVVNATTLDGLKTTQTVFNASYDHSFVYTIGEVVSSDTFNDDIRIECTNGIHFFMTRQEAVNY